MMGNNAHPFSFSPSLISLPDETEIQSIHDFLWEVFRFYVSGHINSFSENKLVQSGQVYHNIKAYLDLSLKMLKELEAERQLTAPLDLPKEISKELRLALELIILTVKPEKIFMVKHADHIHPENELYTHLIIIISNKFQRKFLELEPLLDFALLNTFRISFSVHVSGRLSDNFEEGLLFYLMNCIPQNLIYDDGVKQMPKINLVKLLESKAKAEANFLSNHHVAETFYQNAKHLFNEGKHALSCFMLQQASELSLRALITAFKGIDKKTHSITELMKHVAVIAPQVDLIFPMGTHGDKVLLKLLEEVYIQSRYETGFVITEEQLTILIDRVAHLLELTKAVFEQNFKCLDIAE